MAIHGEPPPAPAVPFRSVRARLEEHARRDPGKVALHDLDQRKSITYGALDRVTQALGRVLRRRGIEPGDRVALLSGEGLEKLVVWMGLWRCGAVVCPFNVELNEAHLGHILGYVRPRLVIRQAALARRARLRDLPYESWAFSDWPAAPDPPAGDLFAAAESPPAAVEADHENDPDDVACIFCTSGTTARPKCVVADHRSYWMNGLSAIAFLGVTAEDRTLEFRSFGWASAQVLSLMPWLETGLTLHVAARFSRRRYFEWIREHAITVAAGVPTVLNMLIDRPVPVTAEDVSSLRFITSSSAPLSPDRWHRFEQLYGVRLLQGYGMSEAGWICANRHDRRKTGTVGPPAKHQQFSIVDAEGNACPPGVEGEITVGGPQLCRATYAPDGTYRERSRPRLRTGDLGIMDAEGFVRVTGRTKELIIRGGVNISPVEIDNVLLAHPKVAEAATVGVPDPVYGEEIVSFVIAKPEATVTIEELRAYCADALPAFKVPRAFTLVEALPLSDRGKLLRDELRARWLESHPG